MVETNILPKNDVRYLHSIGNEWEIAFWLSKCVCVCVCALASNHNDSEQCARADKAKLVESVLTDDFTKAIVKWQK